MSSMIMAMVLFVFFTLLFVFSYLFVFKKNSNEIDCVRLYKKVEACLFYLIVLIFLAFGFWASR